MHPVTRYALDVVCGRYGEMCGEWEKAACLRHLRDLCRSADCETGAADDFPYVFDNTRADRWLRFASSIPRVDKPSSLITLEPWQIFDFCSLYGWVRRGDGKRRFKRGYIRNPRGHAKTTVGSICGLYAMSADAIYPPFEPKKALFENDPIVNIIAVDRKQGGISRSDMATMASTTPALAKRLDIKRSYIRHRTRGGMVDVFSGDKHNKDGGRPTFILTEEWHAHVTPDVHNIGVSGMGKRAQCLELIITTAGDDAENKPCYADDKQYKLVLSGEIKQEDTFVMIREVGERDDPHDKRVWCVSNSFFRRLPEYLRSYGILPDDCYAVSGVMAERDEYDALDDVSAARLALSRCDGNKGAPEKASAAISAFGAAAVDAGDEAMRRVGAEDAEGRPVGAYWSVEDGFNGERDTTLAEIGAAADALYDSSYGRGLYETVSSEHDDAYGANNYAKIREWLIKRMNRWQADAENKYLDAHAMEMIASQCVQREVFRELTKGLAGHYGFDLGKTQDLSGVAWVCSLPDGKIGFAVHGFMPQERAAAHERSDRVPYLDWARDGYVTLTPGEVTDNRYVERWIYDCEKERGWHIAEIDYDGHNAVDMAIRIRETLHSDEKVVEISQTCAGLNQATKRLRELILAGKVVCEYSPLLLWCMRNAIEVVNNFGDSKLSKKHKDDTQRIDPVAALINALARLIVKIDNKIDVDARIKARGYAIKF